MRVLGSRCRVVTTYLLAGVHLRVILVVDGSTVFGRDAMFLKRLQRRKNGKGHTYWALVESIRTAKGSRHRVVAYLGELKKSEKNGWAQLCHRLNGRARPQPSLFDPPHYDEPTDDEAVLVKLKNIGLERLRDFGDVWLALGLWRLLGLDQLLSHLMPSGREEVSWEQVAAILRRFEQYLTEKDWHEIQAGVEVKLVPGPDGEETFVLARSADRRKKEQAMHQRFLDRMEEALTKMRASMESGRLKDEAVAQRWLGRLQERYWRAAAAFEIKITKRQRHKSEPSQGKQSKDKACLSITWHRRQSWSDWVTLSEGCYLLRTNLTETDPATLWKQYIQLTEAEWAFRIEKHELGIRPIWHQKEDRVLGHILVCFLGYVLWKALAQWMRRAGLGDAPRTLLEEFAKIKSGDVVLPAQRVDGSRRTIHLRWSSGITGADGGWASTAAAESSTCAGRVVSREPMVVGRRRQPPNHPPALGDHTRRGSKGAAQSSRLDATPTPAPAR